MNISTGLTGLSIKGTLGVSGLIGSTGINGFKSPTQKAELIPKKAGPSKSKIKYVCPKTHKNHCPFGPAVCIKMGPIVTKEEWWIDGIQLSKEYIEKVKRILDPKNLEEAPLHMNDEILSYPARWVLRFGDKQNIEGLEE